MRKPSNDWLARLRLIILESSAEIGLPFATFIDELNKDMLHEQIVVNKVKSLDVNYELAQAIDKIKADV